MLEEWEIKRLFRWSSLRVIAKLAALELEALRPEVACDNY